uniref:C-C motif chemokine n=1 Tax=Gasterosteus aculeatus aculeatus TaxID=481459 RepID=G3Q9E9_GASAC|nr:C-C motif chemokine 4 homolog [Gasterosteus aculeatus aculeatus]
MRTTNILLLCILGCALIASAIGNSGTGPDHCCFTPYPRRLNKKLIRSYYMTDHRCPKSGVILITQKGRHICVDPDLSWVGNIMSSVDGSTF